MRYRFALMSAASYVAAGKGREERRKEKKTSQKERILCDRRRAPC